MTEKMRTFKIESRETNETFTGSYGLVVKPDQYTIEKVQQLAKSLAPNANFLVEKPHITLYHANFINLPVNEVQKILQSTKNLQGQSLKLKYLQIFGDKFLFWNIEKTDEIQKAHEEALKLSQYLDKEAQLRAITEEKLSLTEQELNSLNKYGHPLTESLYLPHITLAYDPNGIKLNSEFTSMEYDMQVDSIKFAEIGQFGSVKDMVELNSR